MLYNIFFIIIISCFCLSFELYFLTRLAPLMYHLLTLFISSLLSLLPLDSFVYSWQKEGEYTREYTGVYCHFYMTHMHILRVRNSTSCTFVRGESHRGYAYTKGEKTFFWENLILSCFTLCLFSRCFIMLWVMLWSLWSFPYDYHVFDQVVHMFHIMSFWSLFTCYIIFFFLSLDLPWGSNAFCEIGRASCRERVSV